MPSGNGRCRLKSNLAEYANRLHLSFDPGGKLLKFNGVAIARGIYGYLYLVIL